MSGRRVGPGAPSQVVTRLAAMRRAARYVPLLAIATLAFPGCGSSDDLPKNIPPASASALQRDLTRAQQACKDGDSSRLSSAADAYSSEVADLPSTVSGKTREVLQQGANSLSDLARTQAGCATGTSGVTGPTGAVPTTPTETASPPRRRPRPSHETTTSTTAGHAHHPRPQTTTTTTESTTSTVQTPTTTQTTPSVTTPTVGGGAGGGGGTTTTGGGTGGVGVGPGKESGN